MNKLIKLDRIAAWALFICLMLYFISGYGITKGIINPSWSAKLHFNWLTYIILVAFVFHTGFAIRLAFMRWQIWTGFGKFIWILFYIIFIGSFVYIDYFYQIKKSQLSTPQVSPAISVSAQPPIALSPSKKAFTLAELSKYDGQNGQPAYVAVDGNVYDLSTVFTNGIHFSHFAGKELTNAFYTRHAKNQITKYPLVGTLVD